MTIFSTYVDTDQKIKVVGPCDHPECSTSVSGTTFQIQVGDDAVSIPLNQAARLIAAIELVMKPVLVLS